MTAALKSVLKVFGIIVALGIAEAYSSGIERGFVLRPSAVPFAVDSAPPSNPQANATASGGSEIRDGGEDEDEQPVSRHRPAPAGTPTEEYFEAEFEGTRGIMIEYAIAPNGMQCGFFGIGSTRSNAYSLLQESKDPRVCDSVIRTLWLEYGAGDRRISLDAYLLRDFNLVIEGADFEGALRRNSRLYQAVLRYFFEKDQAQLTFHPGTFGFLDGLAILLNQRVVVWGRDFAGGPLKIQHDTKPATGHPPHLVHLILDNGHFNFLEFQTENLDLGAIKKLKEKKKQDEESMDLLEAAKAGNREVVEKLISEDADVKNQHDNLGQTALHFATARKHPELVRLLVEDHEVDVNQQDARGQTALHHAANRGHFEIVELLVSLGASVDQPDGYGQTALHHAAHKGHPKVVQLLKQLGANIQQRGSINQTALHYAANQGHAEVVELLINLGIPVDQPDGTGQTALHHAAHQGHAGVVQSLKRLGANIQQRDDIDQTALHHAANQGHAEVVELLINLGIPVDQPDGTGQTALHHAVYGQNLEAIRVLIKYETNVNYLDRLGNTALHNAIDRLATLQVYGADTVEGMIIHPSEQIMRLLLAHGANRYQLNNYDEDPIDKALVEGQGDLIEDLAGSKEINDVDHQGRTRLCRAIERNDERAVRVLIQLEGAALHQPCADGRLPIGIAAFWGHQGLVQDLHRRRMELDPGAHINQADRNHRTSLAYAVLGGELEMIDLLVREPATLPVLRIRCGDRLVVVRENEVQEPGFEINPHQALPDGVSLLELAVEGGHEAAVHYILEEVMGIFDAQAVLTAAQSQQIWAAIYLALARAATVVHNYEEDGPKGQAGAIEEFFARYYPYIYRTLRDAWHIPAQLDIDINRPGFTVLHFAALAGYSHIVEYLIRAQMRMDRRDDQGRTALHYAAIGGDAMVVEQLVVAGADVNERDSLGQTPLHLAAQQGRRRVVQLLTQDLPVGLRADTHLTDHQGRTALDLATAEGHEAVVKVLDPNRPRTEL